MIFGNFNNLENLGRWGGAAVFGATKSLKASGFPILGVKFEKEITRASDELTTGKPWKSLKKPS